MPSLEEILKKTKVKSEQVKIVRKPPSIATEDRPYSIFEDKTRSDIIAITPSPIVESLIPTTFKDKVNPATKRQQSGDKLVTNRQQTDNKLTTSHEQDVNNSIVKKQNWQQSDNQTGNTIGNKVATNRQQSSNKVATKITFSALVGLQRDITIFICHECKNSRSRTTEPLTIEHIAKSLKRNAGAVKTTLQRLEKKGCIIRVEFKNGRGGWSRYEVPDGIYHDVLRNETGNKVTTNWQQTDNKLASQLTTEPATSASSSSSFLNIKDIKTTTGGISEEWNFDIVPYQKWGFSNSQLKQLAALGVISASAVEQSLIEFNFDIENNLLLNIKTNKINYLMGLLRKGVSYTSEAYLNEQEATISEMARRASAKRENALKAKFEAWEADLSDDERKEIEKKLPTVLMVRHRAHGINDVEVRNWLLQYYLHQYATENSRE